MASVISVVNFSKEGVRMAKTTAWQREHFQPGGGDPFLFYVVFGEFEEPFNLSRKAYRSTGIPDGIKVMQYSRPKDQYVFETFTRGVFAGFLSEHLDLQRAVNESPQCIVVKGTVTDPTTLDYFRDVVGLITFLIDHGGVAVADTQILRWWTPENWRRDIFEPAKPEPGRHVVILISEEDEGDYTVWMHTRGMRKFGRPDLSIHGVNPAYQEVAVEMCNRFVQMQATGHVIPDGQQISMKGLPQGMVCTYRGNMDDPDFNNVHIEIEWPKGRQKRTP